MIRALSFAFTLTIATAQMYEWKGIFYTPEDTYKWGAQKVSGAYVDPTMVLVAIPASEASAQALAAASGKGTEAMALSCEAVNSGGTITPAENKCYKLVFDQSSDQSMYTVNAAGVTAIAFFGQHLPTEFEETEHYFKDTTGTDIEPVAQEPDGGHGHDHGHGGPDAWKSMCVCQAKQNDWKLDCTNKAKIEEAVSKLDADSSCAAEDPSGYCTMYYHVMQAHHDHCLHDSLPTGIEKKLHDYEEFYDDCFVKRQFDPDLSACPEVDCKDSTALTKAVATLQAGCQTATACADKTCGDAIKTVLAAHDWCPESDLPNNLEDALHDHEEACEAQLCNTAEAAFDPYADSCGDMPTPAPTETEEAPPTASDASRFASQAFFVTTLVASCGVLISL